MASDVQQLRTDRLRTGRLVIRLADKVFALRRERRDLLAECDRADALAGDRGGFVETKRIRELLGGGS